GSGGGPAPGRAGAGAPTGRPGFGVTGVLGFDPAPAGAPVGVAPAGSSPGFDGPQRTLVRLAGPPQAIAHPAGGSPPSMSVFPGLGAFGAASAGASAGPTFDMPGQSAAFTSAPLASSLQVTGSPTVRIQVSGTGEVALFGRGSGGERGGGAAPPDERVARLGSGGARRGRGGGAGARGARGGGAGASGARGGGAGASGARGGGAGASGARGGGAGAS